jgi:hypothetical protein
MTHEFPPPPPPERILTSFSLRSIPVLMKKCPTGMIMNFRKLTIFIGVFIDRPLGIMQSSSCSAFLLIPVFSHLSVL